MKGLRAALISTGIGALVVLLGSLVNWLMKAFEASSKADKKFEEQQEILKAGNEAYIKASMEIENYKNKLESFKGTKAQEKEVVKELNSKYGEAMGYYKTLAEWKTVLKQKGEKYCEMLMLEAQAQALLTKRPKHISSSKRSEQRPKTAISTSGGVESAEIIVQRKRP